MKKLTEYFRDLEKLSSAIKVTDQRNSQLSLSEGIKKAVDLIFGLRSRNRKLIFIGNGGSASIASHQAVDFWKNACIPAIAFNDASLLTCVSNDYGYERVFQKPVEMFAQKGDILIAISSSGRSKNIINAVTAAKGKGCFIFTLSGFDVKNQLRTRGDLNFYVPSCCYGPVEITHLAICHCILDYIIENNKAKLFKK